jgi:hypothetical protein
MPNLSGQAAGEAMPTITLEALMSDYVAAMEAVTAYPGPIEKTPVEAAFLAAVDALAQTSAAPSSYEGMMKAIRLAGQEVEDFSGSEMGDTLVKGVLAFLEEREMELPVDRVDRLARELAETLPRWANGSFMAMVYPDNDARGYWFRTVTVGDDNAEADPLIKVINEHNRAWSEYCAVDFAAEEEAGLKSAWQKPYAVLQQWDSPCTSRDSAIAAMKMAMDEIDAGDGPLARPLMLAVLGYLEGAEA